jgi:Zn-dependent protease
MKFNGPLSGVMRGSIKIGSILRIPIYLHLSFLIILPLFAYAFSVQSVRLFGLEVGFGGVDLTALGEREAVGVRLFMGTVAAVFFFACVLFHELGHSYVAQRYGVNILSITLIIFGGLARMEQIPREPEREFKIALAGPSVNFVIALAGFGVLQIPFRGLSLPLELVAILVGLITAYNLLLGLFNLIPAFPMDGGRVLRSILARKMSYVQATGAAAAVGKAFAFAFGIIGLFYNPWLILIALFVYLGAGEEERITKISYTLEGIRVGDIMTREVSTVPKDLTVAALLDRMMSEKHHGYPVVDGRLEGIVTLSDAIKVPPEMRGQVRVEQVMSRELVTIGPQAEAMEVLNLMSRHQIGRLVVVEGGRIAGIITRSDVIKSLDLLKAVRGI